MRGIDRILNFVTLAVSCSWLGAPGSLLFIPPPLFPGLQHVQRPEAGGPVCGAGGAGGLLHSLPPLLPGIPHYNFPTSHLYTANCTFFRQWNTHSAYSQDEINFIPRILIIR
jgi:hypothetical protein